jgi:hypothetical protein
MALPRLPARADRVSPRANDNTQFLANSRNEVPNPAAQAHIVYLAGSARQAVPRWVPHPPTGWFSRRVDGEVHLVWWSRSSSPPPRSAAYRITRGHAMSTGTRRPGSPRRDFLKGVGAASAGLVAGSVGGAAGRAGSATAGISPASPRSYANGGGGAPASSIDFGRIFSNLPPFAEADDTVRAALLEAGQPGGVVDAQDDLAAGPKALVVDPTVNGNPTAANPYGTNPDNPTMTAGRRSWGSSPITTSRLIRPRSWACRRIR